MKIYTGTSNRPLALNVCRELSELTGEDIGLAKAYVGCHSDGEVAVRIGVDDFNDEVGVDEARGRNVFIIQSLQPPAEHIVELEFMIDALSRQSPRSITAVIPYYGYGRQERKDKSGKAIAARRIARDISDSFMRGIIPKVILVDPHVDTIEGFFDVPVDLLYASYMFVPFVQGLNLGEFTVEGTDVGSAEMAGFYARAWGQKMALGDKHRIGPGEVVIRNIIGKVLEFVLIVDDLADTIGTLLANAKKLRKEGVKRIYAWAVHPVFSGKAVERLREPAIDKFFVSDSIPLSEEVKATGKVEVVSIAPMLAQAIHRIYEEQSLTPLVIQL